MIDSDDLTAFKRTWARTAMETMLLWGFGLLAAAVMLMVVEIFIPSAGILSITAACVAIAGVVCLFRYSDTYGYIGAGLVVLGGPVIFFIGLQLMPQTPLGRSLVLGAQDEDQDRPPPAPDRLTPLVGAEGEVVTDLRPIGRVKIGNEKFDALSETTLIRAGSKVKVVGIVDGTSLKVRAI